MATYRVHKNTDYTTINNKFLKRKDLSWKAKGILSYLLSLPDDWELHFNELKKNATDGKTSTRSGLDELKDNGYLIYTKTRNEEGKFIHNYDIYEVPQDVSPNTEKRDMDNRDTDNRDVLLSTDELNTNKQNTNNNKEISKYADEISAVYNHWIELLSDVNEAQLTKRQKKTILTKLKKWSVKKLKQSISNYNEMYRSDYYYSHNFTMYKFIKQSNGAPRFLPGLDDKYDGDLWKDYKNSNNKQSTNDPLAGFK